MLSLTSYNDRCTSFTTLFRHLLSRACSKRHLIYLERDYPNLKYNTSSTFFSMQQSHGLTLLRVPQIHRTGYLRLLARPPNYLLCPIPLHQRTQGLRFFCTCAFGGAFCSSSYSLLVLELMLDGAPSVHVSGCAEAKSIGDGDELELEDIRM